MRRRLVSLVSLVSLASLASCKSLAVEDGKGAGIRPPIHADDRRDASILAAPDAAHSAEPVVVAEPPLPWGTRPAKDGVLFPLVDGMCIHGEVFALQNGPLFAYGSSHGAYSRGGSTTTARITEEGLAPQSNVGFGDTFQFWGVKTIGGEYPDHLWAIVDVSSRMVQASELRVGTAKAGDWKVAVDSGAKFGDAGNQAVNGTPVRDFGKPLPMPDGSTLVRLARRPLEREHRRARERRGPRRPRERRHHEARAMVTRAARRRSPAQGREDHRRAAGR